MNFTGTTTISVGIPLIPILKNPKIVKFINDLFSVTGQFMSVAWRRELKVRKAFTGVSVEKHVEGVFRAGINYDNKASVQEKRESGELPEKNAGLPWGEWFQHPYLIINKEHTQLYVRLYPTPNCVVKAKYFLNGAPVDSFEDVREFVLASEYPKDEPPETICVNISNLLL